MIRYYFPEKGQLETTPSSLIETLKTMKAKVDVNVDMINYNLPVSNF